MSSQVLYFSGSGLVYFQTFSNVFYIGSGDDFTLCFWLQSSWRSAVSHNYGDDYSLFEIKGGVTGPFYDDGPILYLGYDPSYAKRPYIWSAFGSMGSPSPNYVTASCDDIEIDTKVVHLAVTLSRSSVMTLYVNAVAVAATDISKYATVGFTPTVAQFNHGGNSSGWGNDTFIDQLRVHKGVALSASAIASIYNSGVGVVVNRTAFAAVSNNGAYVEFDDGPTILTHEWSGGVNWTDTNTMGVNDYGAGGVSLTSGGIPWTADTTVYLPTDTPRTESSAQWGF